MKISDSNFAYVSYRFSYTFKELCLEREEAQNIGKTPSFAFRKKDIDKYPDGVYYKERKIPLMGI